VRAALGIDALVFDSEPLDRLAADDVALQDLLDIFELDIPVPNSLGINDHVGAVLALVEAPRRVGPHRGLQVPLLDLYLEALSKTSAPIGVATASRVPLRAGVGANEEVVLETGHSAPWSAIIGTGGESATQESKGRDEGRDISAFTPVSGLSILSFLTWPPLLLPLPDKALSSEVP
jgi:hypothetical protein